MHKWMYRVFFMIASMVVLVHNITPHHHFMETNTPDNHDDDHGESDHLGTHYLNNSFTNQSDFPEYKAFHSLEIVLPQLFQFLTGSSLAAADEHQVAIDESPPLFYLIPSLSYRGPPSC